MPSITFVATGHKEVGLCNSHELFKIIEQIKPEVIFEEIPPGKFEAVYAGTRQQSLEVKTIKAYLHKYPATHHIPVDLDIDEATENEIKAEVDGIAFICNDYNAEYNYLSRLLSHWKEKLGFQFLNNDQCSKFILRQRILERQVLDALRKDNNQREIDHDRLNLAYNQWIDQIENRENEMLRNIYSYMEQKKYNRALFLVGAAHRKPIMQKIQEYESKAKIKLIWTFYK
ncbi:MAG: hypothetical protein IPP99_11925 [Chitinophagaceae bacterium]|nr:hypothetical protein [Chitinophagaceae bacterium]